MTRESIDRTIHTFCNTLSGSAPDGWAQVTVYPDGHAPGNSTTIEAKHLAGLLEPLCIRLKDRRREPTIYIDGHQDGIPAAAIFWHPRNAHEAMPVVVVTLRSHDEAIDARRQAEMLAQAHEMIAWHCARPENASSFAEPVLAT